MNKSPYKIIILIILLIAPLFLIFAKDYTFDELLDKSPFIARLAIKDGINRLNGSKNELVFKRLEGGLSKANAYVFFLDNEKYVLRILDPKYSIIERQAEIKAHTIGSELNIAPKVLFADSGASIIIMPFIEGETLSKKHLEDENVLKELARVIKKLHSYAKDDYPLQLTRIESIKQKHDKIIKQKIACPLYYYELYNELIVKDPFELSLKKVPCHDDLNPSNIILGKDDKIYIIDWPKATLDYAYIDLSWLCSLSNMTTEQIKILLEAYFEKEPTNSELNKLFLGQQISNFFIATTYLGHCQSLEDVKIPIDERVKYLDDLLKSNSLKPSSAYIEEGVKIPITADKDILKIYALGFLKECKKYEDFKKFKTFEALEK